MGCVQARVRHDGHLCCVVNVTSVIIASIYLARSVSRRDELPSPTPVGHACLD